ncbi:MAG: maleylpyruvate isomerase N-terminal domain-containing protein [Actinomycetota bacterium]
MQLNPRYGPDPIITLDGEPSAIAEPLVRQRQRLADALEAFTDAEWSHPSRCDGWSARDVIVHLESTNLFWTASIAAGVKGTRTEFLAEFDPVASPAELVDAAAARTTAEVLEGFTASNDALLGTVRSLDADEWTVQAEAPPGHQPVAAVLHHALWDSFVHERDILVPMGAAPEPEPDEVIASLRYAVALSGAFSINHDRGRGALSVRTRDPDEVFHVVADDAVRVDAGVGPTDAAIEGDALDLLERLSARRPLGDLVPDEVAWMFTGLFEVFDQA